MILKKRVRTKLNQVGGQVRSRPTHCLPIPQWTRWAWLIFLVLQLLLLWASLKRRRLAECSSFFPHFCSLLSPPPPPPATLLRRTSGGRHFQLRHLPFSFFFFLGSSLQRECSTLTSFSPGRPLWVRYGTLALRPLPPPPNWFILGFSILVCLICCSLFLSSCVMGVT